MCQGLTSVHWRVYQVYFVLTVWMKDEHWRNVDAGNTKEEEADACRSYRLTEIFTDRKNDSELNLRNFHSVGTALPGVLKDIVRWTSIYPFFNFTADRSFLLKGKLMWYIWGCCAWESCLVDYVACLYVWLTTWAIKLSSTKRCRLILGLLHQVQTWDT